jgi:hypothetical protein
MVANGDLLQHIIATLTLLYDFTQHEDCELLRSLLDTTHIDVPVFSKHSSLFTTNGLPCPFLFMLSTHDEELQTLETLTQ